MRRQMLLGIIGDGRTEGTALLFLLLTVSVINAGCAGVAGSKNPAGTPPAVAVTAPANGSSVSGTITVSASASATSTATIAGVQFLLDGANLGAELLSAPYSMQWDSKTVGNGSHTLAARARDRAGNQTTGASVTITVANGSGGAPTVAITAPANGASVSGTLTISASASATSPATIAGVQFLIDGANLGAEVLSAPYSQSWDTATVANGLHTLTARARDSAGAMATSAGVSVTVSNGSGGADFQTRCSAPGVVKCVGFDSPADITGTYGDPSGILLGEPGAVPPAIDPSMKASGVGSLKFTIPANVGSDPGSYFTNFSGDLSVQFGENSDFYIQWRQRFSPEFITNQYAGTNGWKNSIIGTGDHPGCTPSFQTSCYSSCSDIEVEMGNYYKQGFPIMYNACIPSTSHGPYDGFYEPFGTGEWKLQNGRPAPYCLFSQGSTVPKTYFPPAGNCFGYFPNEWMTFQVHIKTGPRRTDGARDEWLNSFVQMWMAREGQPSQLVIDWGPYNLTAGTPASNQKFGKIWLLPYMTEKDPIPTYPIAYTWYDELIVSRQKILDPR